MPAEREVREPRRRTERQRTDRCPGVLRPWMAEDGALVRIRLVGGSIGRHQLRGLSRLAGEHGDGRLHLTTRANVQIRGIGPPVPRAFVDEVQRLGLLPSPAHERVRNIMVSPLSGRVGGAADVRATARELDERLLGDPLLADLPARFLFCLDDRGDLRGREADLAAVAVAPGRARLWAGGLAGDVVDLEDVPALVVDLARRFMTLRGEGPTAPWHVAELPGGGSELGPFSAVPDDAPAPAVPASGDLPQDDGRVLRHLPVPDGELTAELVEHVLGQAGDEVVVTPWRSVMLPDLET